MTKQDMLSPEAIASTIAFMEHQDPTRNFYTADELHVELIPNILGVEKPQADSDVAALAAEVAASYPINTGQPYLAHLGGYMLSAQELQLLTLEGINR